MTIISGLTYNNLYHRFECGYLSKIKIELRCEYFDFGPKTSETQLKGPQGQTLFSDWKFSSQHFPPSILLQFHQTQSCTSQVATFMLEKNSGLFSHRASIELLLLTFHSFVLEVSNQ